MIRFQDEDNREPSSPDMTPMIDMIFILLIFFLITSLIASPLFRVKPPESTTAEVSGVEGELVIELDVEGRYYLDDQSISAQQLRLYLENELGESSNKTVYIRADKQVSFDTLVIGIDLVKESGAEEVGFLVEKP